MLDLYAQALPTVLVTYEHLLQPPAFLGRVHRKVVAPDVVDVFDTLFRPAVLQAERHSAVWSGVGLLSDKPSARRRRNAFAGAPRLSFSEQAQTLPRLIFFSMDMMQLKLG